MSFVLEGEEIENKSLFWRASPVAASLGVLAFWCGVVVAARSYPSGYDWRDMSVSFLASPERNPAGYLWASAGIAICGLCGLFWAAVLARRGGDRLRGIWALKFGFFFMICAGVLPKWLLRIRKGHEYVAALAFTGLLIGMVRLMFQTAERTFLRLMSGLSGHARPYAFVVASAAVLPILLAGLAQAYFYYVPPDFHWISFSWRVRGWPVVLRFPFWEWVTCVVLSAYMVILPSATHAVYANREDGEEA